MKVKHVHLQVVTETQGSQGLLSAASIDGGVEPQYQGLSHTR